MATKPAEKPVAETTTPAAPATPDALAPKKRGPKKGYKRSPEAIEKARATRAANKAKKGGTTTAKAKTAKTNGAAAVKKFKLYSVEGNELGYLIAVEGDFKNGGEAVQKAVADKQVSPAIQVVAIPEAALVPHVVDEIPQEPLYVLRSTEEKPAPKKRGRPRKTEQTPTEPPQITPDNPFN